MDGGERKIELCFILDVKHMNEVEGGLSEGQEGTSEEEQGKVI